MAQGIAGLPDRVARRAERAFNWVVSVARGALGPGANDDQAKIAVAATSVLVAIGTLVGAYLASGGKRGGSEGGEEGDKGKGKGEERGEEEGEGRAGQSRSEDVPLLKTRRRRGDGEGDREEEEEEGGEGGRE